MAWLQIALVAFSSMLTILMVPVLLYVIRVQNRLHHLYNMRWKSFEQLEKDVKELKAFRYGRASSQVDDESSGNHGRSRVRRR